MSNGFSRLWVFLFQFAPTLYVKYSAVFPIVSFQVSNDWLLCLKPWIVFHAKHEHILQKSKIIDLAGIASQNIGLGTI